MSADDPLFRVAVAILAIAAVAELYSFGLVAYRFARRGVEAFLPTPRREPAGPPQPVLMVPEPAQPATPETSLLETLGDGELDEILIKPAVPPDEPTPIDTVGLDPAVEPTAAGLADAEQPRSVAEETRSESDCASGAERLWLGEFEDAELAVNAAQAAGRKPEGRGER